MNFQKYTLLYLLCVLSINVAAQKLPSIQKESMFAPTAIKIDGNTDEWGNMFKAYNPRLSVFYTIANDNDNLYLIIQAPQKPAIEKILGGGITFTVESAVKSSAPFSITYPLLSSSNRIHIFNIQLRDTTKKTADMLPGLNRELASDSKEIKTKGFISIADSLISVYNEYGIKIAALFNNDRAYTYELAIPLKYLNKLAGDKKIFNYIIQLNGIDPNSLITTVNGKSVNASSPEYVDLMLRMGNTAVLDRMNPTNFSGTYALAK